MKPKQSDAGLLPRLERRRAEAARVLAQATPGPVKRYRVPGHLHPSGLSRARQGDTSNPLLRVAVLLEAMRQAGARREDAEHVLAHIEGVVDDLWPVAAVDWQQAMREEQARDAAEDVAQVDALIDPLRLPGYVERAERHVAAARVSIAAARQFMAMRRRAA